MQLPARPLFLVENKHSPLLSYRIKLLIVSFIFFIAILSGSIPVPYDQSPEEPVVQAAESTYIQAENTAINNNEVAQSQIKVVTIGQKSVPHPTPRPTSIPPAKEEVWGIAKKIDTHTYTMQLGSDGKIGTKQEILAALNNYRRQHGSGELKWDDTLADFANRRAEYFTKINKLDNHDGFFDFVNKQDGFKKLGYGKLGENSSFGFTLEAVHLIEWVYAGDESHNSNQLDKNWHFTGIGVNGTSTDLIFATDKL